MKTLFDKLEAVAARVEREKGLSFFAAVHPVGGLHDRWDLLVSSPDLAPWSMEGLRYVARALQEILKIDDIVKIARIVVLPRNNDVIASLENNDQIQAGKLTMLHDERFDRVFLVRPAARQPATMVVDAQR